MKLPPPTYSTHSNFGISGLSFGVGMGVFVGFGVSVGVGELVWVLVGVSSRSISVDVAEGVAVGNSVAVSLGGTSVPGALSVAVGTRPTKGLSVPDFPSPARSESSEMSPRMVNLSDFRVLRWWLYS